MQAHHVYPAAITLASSLPMCIIQDQRAGIQVLHDLMPAYLAEDCQLVSVTGYRQLHALDINMCLV